MNEHPIPLEPEWANDAELFALLKRECYSPVLGDILDQLGHLNHFLSQPIQPMEVDMVVAGRAMPVLYAEVFTEPDKPFGLLTEALDQLEEGEVWIGTGCQLRSAMWGEILTATARVRGAVGAVVNGFHRDTPKVLEQDWPVFSRGRYAADSAPRNRVLKYRTTIVENGVTVRPGDLVFADLDGVLVIPRELEVEVVTKALEKARAEKTVRQAIENGMSCTDAFNKYGVL